MCAPRGYSSSRIANPGHAMWGAPRILAASSPIAPRSEPCLYPSARARRQAGRPRATGAHDGGQRESPAKWRRTFLSAAISCPASHRKTPASPNLRGAGAAPVTAPPHPARRARHGGVEARRAAPVRQSDLSARRTHAVPREAAEGPRSAESYARARLGTQWPGPLSCAAAAHTRRPRRRRRSTRPPRAPSAPCTFLPDAGSRRRVGIVSVHAFSPLSRTSETIARPSLVGMIGAHAARARARGGWGRDDAFSGCVRLRAYDGTPSTSFTGGTWRSAASTCTPSRVGRARRGSAARPSAGAWGCARARSRRRGWHGGTASPGSRRTT
jgi:hypothetical protein